MATRREFIGALAATSLMAAGPENKYPRDLTKADVERWMTELANWGRWGKEDMAGTVNLITPAKRKQAAALIREGISVSMSLDADTLPKGAEPEPSPPPTPPGGRGPRPRYTWQH